MAGNAFDSLSVQQKLRCSLQKDINAICVESTHYVGMEIDRNAMDLMGELIWKKIQVFGSDLECFARHAKRSTITSDDIKLLVRRNPSLLAHITKSAQETASSTVKKSKDTKRKRTTIQNVQNTNAINEDIINPKPSTSNAAMMSTDDAPEEMNSDSNDSPFMKMLNKRINEKQNMNKTNNNLDEDIIDLSD